MRTTRMAAGVLTMTLLLTGACSSDDSDTTPTAETTSTTAQDGTQDLSISTPEGQVSLSLDGVLPPDWPEDFPIPDRTEVAGSGSLERDDAGVMVGVYTTKESGQDAFDFYAQDDSLEPTDPSSAGVGSGFVGTVDIGGPYDGSVTVAGVEDSVYLVVVLNTAADSSSSSSSSTTATAG